VRHEDIPDINNPKIRFPVLEGDKLMKEVLNGGYNVHPVPPPKSEIKERIRKRYERERTQKIRLVIEKIFSLKPTILKSQVKTKPVTQLITNNKKKSEMKRTGN